MKRLLIYGLALAASLTAMAQESTNSGVRRRDAAQKQAETSTPGVTDRMKQKLGDDNSSLSEGDVQWMRVIYRELDLNKDANAPLYFPEDLVDGDENLFRIILRLLANGQIPAYEYLDGREIFTDEYKVKVRDQLDRFYIYYTEAKGSTEKNPKFEIQESDVPTNEVLSYYIIEKWEFDNRNNRMKTRVEAICPRLHRSADFGGEAQKYPMFWIKYSDLRPYLAQQEIFIDDDNNLPTCTYDDFFTLNMYDGEIYKTRNLKNKSMGQLYEDPDDMKRAQDSIQARLDGFESKLWVPNREEIIAAREAREAAAAAAPADSTSLGDIAAAAAASSSDDKKSTRKTARSTKKEKTKKTKVKETKVKSSSSSATRSVRRQK
ncbi:MAG: gliding motility protein GldN [Bacteroidales bacterium]|nr:gliding motility protein GldN [Bacteroidales bacterium]